MQSGIYQIRGPDKVYIGQAQNITDRFRAHRHRLNKGDHRNKHLQSAWNKYGESAFVFELLAFFSLEDLNKAEQAALDSIHANGKYNIAVCAEAFGRGLKRSEETRRKLSLANIGNKRMLGKKHSEESKKKMSLASFGKPKSLQMREKMKIVGARNADHLRALSEARKGKPGKKHSEETKRKISAIRKAFVDKQKESSL